MKNNILKAFLVLFIMILIVGCGKDGKKESAENKTQETEIVEVTEEATVEENEQGEVTVTTESGEQIVVTQETEQTKNEDGSVTYKTEDGAKVTVNTDGSATVTTEEEKPVAETTKPNGSNEEKHTHSYSASVTTQASCTKEGVKTYTCSCGDSYSKAIAKTSHIASDWQVVTNATCKSEGKRKKVCTICGTEMETGKIAKTGHTSSKWITTKEATCSSNGSKHKICTVCNTELETGTIKANGSHSYTWETDGNMRTMKCSGCKASGITEYKYGDVWGYFDDSKANELFSLVNAQRNATEVLVRDDFGNPIKIINVASLNKNNSLTTKAKNRASEVAKNFNHAGEQHECLAWGQGNAGEAFQSWCYSDRHRKAMLDSAYSIGGVACFYYDSDNSGANLTPIWVLELGF